jgi:hypothetical protein
MAANLHDERQRYNLWRLLMWGTAAGLLLLPAIAMQYTAEVNWGPEDFIVMGVLLAGACGIVELGAYLSRSPWYRLGFAVAVFAGFVTVWVNLAVGMIHSEDNFENLVFVGVLAIAAIGALIARFRAAGLVWAMVAAAVAQAACAVFAAVIDSLYVGFLVLCFSGLWLVAAGLFWKAARGREGGA